MSRLDAEYDQKQHHDLHEITDESTIGLIRFVAYCYCGDWWSGTSKKDVRTAHAQHRDEMAERRGQ
jgi:hypothetical protein